MPPYKNYDKYSENIYLQWMLRGQAFILIIKTRLHILKCDETNFEGCHPTKIVINWKNISFSESSKKTPLKMEEFAIVCSVMLYYGIGIHFQGCHPTKIAINEQKDKFFRKC